MHSNSMSVGCFVLAIYIFCFVHINHYSATTWINLKCLIKGKNHVTKDHDIYTTFLMKLPEQANLQKLASANAWERRSFFVAEVGIGRIGAEENVLQLDSGGLVCRCTKDLQIVHFE